MRRVNDAAVDDVIRELETNGLSADCDKLKNLLRHWVGFVLREGPVSEHREARKNDRDAAKALQKPLQQLDDLISKQMVPSAYSVSQHLDQPFRVHRSQPLLDMFQKVVQELLPAIDGLASVTLKRGVSKDHEFQFSIETLLVIFEFVTGVKACRINNPIEEMEGGPFRAFAERCLRMLRPDDDLSIRSVIKARKEEQEIVLEVSSQQETPRRQAGLSDD